MAPVDAHTLGCDVGTHAGELVFAPLSGNAEEARLPVQLTITP